MASGLPGGDYHALLGLHHGMRLRRYLNGQTGGSTVVAGAPTVESWPQRQDDQRLLRESLACLDPLPDALLFMYGALFRDRPHMRGMFPGSIHVQRDRLTACFLALIDALDAPGDVVPAVAELGRDHRKLGVLPQHYAVFADALAEALRTAGGEHWRDAYHEAWLRLYWFTARLMIEAAEEFTTDPPYHTGEVVSHERRRPDLAVLRVRTARAYRYRAGQHATLESPLLPRAWRCYSMATPPTGDGLLEFHVRARGVGGLSDVLVERTGPGDRLRVGPARGRLSTGPLTGAAGVLLVAGGTGLAPIRALLGALAREAAPPRTVLFAGARTGADLYDLDSLTAAARAAPWLSVVPAVAAGPAYPFDEGTLPEVVARHGPWPGHHAVLAGPPAMVAALNRLLPDLGIPAGHVQFDPE
ncbi:globin domain-containing protein [Dactylosporangium sp. CA-092794]|uniref:globin domain-containing protein n=1 Tax=Dactylosporangium sp. CA-092794 TaxID=3239929 RepID=UPI003D8B5141